MKFYTIVMFVALTLATNLNAQTTSFSTDFDTSDGFVTGGFGDVTVAEGLITFSGGQQQQAFLPAAYNNGPAAYLFVNGDVGFAGSSSIAAITGDTGNISFGGLGATDVSFHAANLGDGPNTIFTSFDEFGGFIEVQTTSVNNLNANPGDIDEILNFTSSSDGRNIFRIEANLPGPINNTTDASYAASIDNFSATVVLAVPEPSSLALLGLATTCGLLRRRR